MTGAELWSLPWCGAGAQECLGTQQEDRQQGHKVVRKAGCRGTGVLWAFRAGVSALFRRSEAEGGVSGVYPLCELESGSLT